MSIPWVWAFYKSALDNNGLLEDPTTGGSVTYVDGKIGKAIDCENTATITFEDSDVLNNDHHTIAFWILMTATSTSYQEILLSSVDNNNANRSPLLMQTTGSVAKIHYRYTDIGTGSGSNTGISDFGNGTATAFTLNTWYHITLIKNGGTASLYVNGAFVESADVSTAYPSMAGQKLRVSYDSPKIYLNDLRIYPAILNKQEIKELAQGLIFHAKLNGDIKDCSGYGAIGTSNNITVSLPDYENDAVIHNQYTTFNYANDSGIAFDDANVQMIKNLVNNEFSVSVWFRTSGYVSHGSSYNYLFSLNNGEADAFSFGIYINSGQELFFNSTGEVLTTGSAVSLNEWHHLVAIKTDTQLKVYLDNVSIGTSSPTFSAQTPITSTFYIGKDGSANNRNITGDISDVRIYATELSTDAINDLYINRARLSSDGKLKTNSLKMMPITRGAENAKYIVTETTTYTIVSFEDSTPIYKNGVLQSTIASAYTTTTVACTEGDILSSTKPFETKAGNREPVPTSWRGYKFIWNFTRNLNGTIYIYSIDEGVDYTVYLDGVSTFTGSIAAGDMATLSITSLGVYYIEVTDLCCVYTTADSNIDTTALFPMREELFGIPSSTGHMMSDGAGLVYKQYISSGSLVTSSAIGAHVVEAYGGSSYYSSPSVRIIADRPFGASAYGDSGGSNSTYYQPRDAMAHKFVLPETASWASFVGLKVSATVKVYNNTGTLVGTETVTGGGVHTDGEEYPTHIKITTDGTYLNTAGWFFICSAPMIGYYEGGNGDERIFYGSKIKDEATYSRFELPNKGGVLGVEEINEVGIDPDQLVFWAPFNNKPRDISGYTPLAITYSGNGEPQRMNNFINEGCYKFDNTTGAAADYYIEYNSLPYTELSASGAFSVSLWFQVDNSGLGDRETILDWNQVILITHETNDKIKCNSYDTNTTSWKGLSTTASISTGLWYHYVASFDGSNITVYINGQQTGTAAQAVTFDSGGSQAVRIGDATWGSEAFDGDICQCMIFTRALSEKEINTLYKMQSNSSAMQRLSDGTLVVRGISDTSNG